jgi:hypothetical protein
MQKRERERERERIVLKTLQRSQVYLYIMTNKLFPILLWKKINPGQSWVLGFDYGPCWSVLNSGPI